MAQDKAKEPCYSSIGPEHVATGDKKKRKKKEKASKRKGAQNIEDISSCEETATVHSKDGEEEYLDERPCCSKGKLLLSGKCK